MAIKTINDTHLTSIADAIRSKLDDNELYDDNGELVKYTPAEMAPAIRKIPSGSTKPIIAPLNVTKNGTYTAPTGVNGYSPVTVNVPTGGAEIPSEAFSISGNCNYRFYNGGWDWFIENYGDQITTSNITDASYMFANSNLTEIPFTINLDINSSSCSCTQMFNNCDLLTALPEIYGKPTTLRATLAGCRRIRHIPDSWGNLDFSYFTNNNYAYMNGFLEGCLSLRSIPATLVSNLHNDKTTAINAKFYYQAFRDCASLDEIQNIPIDGVTITNNMFYYSFYYCTRLKNMTFATDNGIPYTANWKGQTIELTTNVGYASTATDILNYNSGITSDKQVTDDTTYQALKDDPDWFTTKIAYSRYNHDSAVATINSLPDTSAYLATAGGTNTIKFKGESGSATDGGAINTLTEEEIAVAAAKGWTVTLV